MMLNHKRGPRTLPARGAVDTRHPTSRAGKKVGQRGGTIISVNVSSEEGPKYSRGRATIEESGRLRGDRIRSLWGSAPARMCISLIEKQAVHAANKFFDSPRGHAFANGGLGENLTVEGIDLSQVQPGQHLRITTGSGDVILKVVSQFRLTDILRSMNFETLRSRDVKRPNDKLQGLCCEVVEGHGLTLQTDLSIEVKTEVND